MLELIFKELENLGCVPRMDQKHGLVISNASRIDSVLADAIREHRMSIIRFLQGTPEGTRETPSIALEEVDPVDCPKCGRLCTVEGFYGWKCSTCDDTAASRKLTRKWLAHKRRIEGDR